MACQISKFDELLTKEEKEELVKNKIPSIPQNTQQLNLRREIAKKLFECVVLNSGDTTLTKKWRRIYIQCPLWKFWTNGTSYAT